MTRWAVILAGGVGSRFWPLSTPARPKQLLPLATNEPLLVDALTRLAALVPPERTLVLTNAGLVEPIAVLAPNLPRENLVAEPRPAGTAAALAWAAHLIQQRAGDDAVMISVHADWAVKDASAFRRALADASAAAEQHHALVTVGVVPDRIDPGFGYIEPGEEMGGGVRRVKRFVEKPDRARAETMIADGYLWNSGIFVWRVGDFLAGFFGAVTSGIAVDVGVLERSRRVLVLRGDFGWDDVGTWAALRRVRECDAEGNAIVGRVHALESRGNVVHAEGNAVVLYGVRDLVVVTRDGLTLVTTTDKAADLKTLVASLPPSMADLA